MKNSKIKKPLWVKLTIIFLSIILGLSILVGGFIGYFRLSIKTYYDNSKIAFEVPNLSSGFVPQGLCYDNDEDANWFLISGHMSDKSPSVIHVVNKDTQKFVKTVKLYKDENNAYTGHAGGVAVYNNKYNNYLYVAGGKDMCIYAFDYKQFKSAKNGDKIVALGAFSTGDIRPSSLEVSGSYLTIVEYQRDKTNELPESHKMTTPNGDKNTALAVRFSLSTSYKKTFGINEEPISVYSIPSQVQGFEFSGKTVYLSTSYGMAFSKIYAYNVNNCSKGKTTVLGHEDVDLYYLDSKCLIETIDAPPMCEEIVVVDNKLYTLTESASNKYFFGKFIGGNWCYATDLTNYGL